MKAPMVAVKADGVVEVHATAAQGDLPTLCGTDDDDPEIGLEPADLPARPHITCGTCLAIIAHCRKYRIRSKP